MLAREAIEWCKLSLMEDSGHSSEDQNADSNPASKDQAQEVQLGKRTPLEAGFQITHVTFQQKNCSCPNALWETEIKVGRKK